MTLKVAVISKTNHTDRLNTLSNFARRTRKSTFRCHPKNQSNVTNGLWLLEFTEDGE
jgi:hypothetical protein